MKFGAEPVGPGLAGAILAHSVRLPDGALKKGTVLGESEIARIRSADLTEVVVARLEPSDMGEDVAAEAVGAALAGDATAAHLRIAAPFTGRLNLYAESAGVLRVDADLIARANAVDEAVTVATLPDYARVAARQMAATVKIIPYAAPVDAVDAVVALLSGAQALRVAPVQRATASLICTRTPGMRDAVIEKGAEAIRARLTALGVDLSTTETVPHETLALAEAVRRAAGEMVLVLAGSATSDRRDVAPAAIEAAGGVVERVGMPVDPGNLLVLGARGETPVIGLPGCARSPKLNGADWVLERIACGLPVDTADIGAMGVGGLLKEIPSRPEPRGGGASAPARPFVSAVLLAAGGSSRMRGAQKLLLDAGGVPLVRRAAERLRASDVDEVVAVVGAQAEEVRTALSGLGLRIVENPNWAEGMASSIGAGLRAIAPRADAAMVALGDMPDVDAALANRLIAAFDPEEGRAIVRPVAASGRPGHPVLFGRRFFEALAALTGDTGARDVVREHADYVVDLAVGSDAPETDLDTPEAWEAWRARRSNDL